ncbi:CaiB/BaiF CoA transferase family protein [Actinomadura atramentaria]|uniref:CaiB/BaiF CoA transferase family protein n=1 Tax=Actinomadura atramentaria TaxID=1990 RepID=UPI000374BCC0|nr:CoA transferase [Actinomadura atramentaria]
MGLLDGLRVLDLTMWRPGPYATLLLAQHSADVLKVEPPGGEPMRAFPGHFGPLNRHKRSVVLDLKDERDRARCHELAAGADAVVEGYRPGVADRLGVGHAALRARNPALVYCSLSGYGASGPLSETPGHDVNYRALAGALPADAPTPSADDLPLADMAAAATAAFAITAACLRARETGAGERLDLGLADVLANWVATVPSARRRGDGPGERPLPGYGVYRARDGRVTLGVVSEQRLWDATCAALGLDHRVGVPFAERLRDASALDREITDTVAALDRDEALALLARHGAPAAPCLTREEAARHPHFRERGVIDGSPFRTEVHAPRTGGAAPELDGHRGLDWPRR